MEPLPLNRSVMMLPREPGSADGLARVKATGMMKVRAEDLIQVLRTVCLALDGGTKSIPPRRDSRWLRSGSHRLVATRSFQKVTFGMLFALR